MRAAGAAAARHRDLRALPARAAPRKPPPRHGRCNARAAGNAARTRHAACAPAATRPTRRWWITARPGCAGTLGDPPGWLSGFAGYWRARLSPTRAVALLHQLATVLADGSNAPAAVLAAARTPGPDRPAASALARALEAFFTSSRLMLPAGTAAQAAEARRSRRIAETPAAFRAAAAAFDDARLQARDRARRAGTRPRADRTLEINLSAVRDLARYLTESRSAVTGWSWSPAVTSKRSWPPSSAPPAGPASCSPCTCSSAGPAHPDHPGRPGTRPAAQLQHRLPPQAAVSRRAAPAPAPVDRRHRRTCARTKPAPPACPSLCAPCLRRRTAAAAQVADIDMSRATIPGSAAQPPVPLDPATSAALRRCLDHHDRHHRGGNPAPAGQPEKQDHRRAGLGQLPRKAALPGRHDPDPAAGHRLAHLVTTLKPGSSSLRPSACAAAPSCATSPTPWTGPQPLANL